MKTTMNQVNHSYWSGKARLFFELFWCVVLVALSNYYTSFTQKFTGSSLSDKTALYQQSITENAHCGHNHTATCCHEHHTDTKTDFFVLPKNIPDFLNNIAGLFMGALGFFFLFFFWFWNKSQLSDVFVKRAIQGMFFSWVSINCAYMIFLLIAPTTHLTLSLIGRLAILATHIALAAKKYTMLMH